MEAKQDHNKIIKADQEDIAELQSRIKLFKSGKEDEERFKLYRLTRGVYGQRQLGVQMFRIKIPYGRLSSDQLRAIADLSDKYASCNLHLTTRQDIQLHYVRLEDSPEIWKGLSANGLTGREACGNTVRNLTCSPTAGIDPDEPFDVTPYAHAMAYHFLRHPVCQEMGRKIKPCFSSSEKDTAFTFFHDFGFIPRVKQIDGKEVRGFKVLVGGGLGAVAIPAECAYDFLPEDEIIPFTEAALRVFDRYGEREKRQKARLKFLVKKLGIEAFLNLVNQERNALPYKKVAIDKLAVKENTPVDLDDIPISPPLQDKNYQLWLKSNVIAQKQKTFHGVYIKVQLGDIKSDQARQLAGIIKKFSSDDIRITIDQNLLIRFVHAAYLPNLYQSLKEIGFADAGYDSTADVTACPGTDTCNLAVTNSTGLAVKIEEYIRENYPELLHPNEIKVKISGCMNACGQHMIAAIGFHGSSIKKDDLVVPAMQIVLGGGAISPGDYRMADKIIKIPTRRVLLAIDIILNDFWQHGKQHSNFQHYYQHRQKKYFYTLLKPLASIEDLTESELMDWGQDHQYKQAIGVGECAGVILDVVGTIIKDAEEKLKLADKYYAENSFPESRYHAYNAHVVAAKALLLSEDIKCNTQIGILEDFEKHFVGSDRFKDWKSFPEKVLQISHISPDKNNTIEYLNQAHRFFNDVLAFRSTSVQTGRDSKEIIHSYYKA